MNLWHYVEIENVESIDLIVSILIIFEKLRKIKINNLKIVTIMKNRLKCNDKNLLKNEINAKNAWKILKNSFSSFESKMLNDLLIKLWIIIFVNNQNVTNYARWFKMTMQNIRKMIINVSINDNLFILYFHLNLDAKFEQYREHYVQIHEIVSNKSNSTKDINYAINRFLNICVNRSISKKLTLVMIVITFVSNLFFDKVQSNAQSEIKNVVIIIVKMCIICSRYVFNLIQIHWQTIKRIFRYLRETYQMKLIFREALKFLKNYTNSNWAEDQNIRRFIFEYAFNVSNDVISWFSKRQLIVTLSIYEIEYTKQISIAKEVIKLRNLMTQLTCDVEYF